MAKPEETHSISVNVPDVVWEWLTVQASAWFTTIEEQVRRIVIESWRKQGISEPVEYAKPRIRSLEESDIYTAQKPRTVKRATSGYRGVYRYGKDAWAPMLTVDKRLVRYGRAGGYADPAQAARVYDAVARKQFGSSAILNFPLNGERDADGMDDLDRRMESLVRLLLDPTVVRTRFAEVQKELFQVQQQIYARDAARRGDGNVTHAEQDSAADDCIEVGLDEDGALEDA